MAPIRDPGLVIFGHGTLLRAFFADEFGSAVPFAAMSLVSLGVLLFGLVKRRRTSV